MTIKGFGFFSVTFFSRPQEAPSAAQQAYEDRLDEAMKRVQAEREC